MDDNGGDGLSYALRELPALHVATLDYRPGPGPAELYSEIHGCFERLQLWARGQGLDPATLRHVGVPVLQAGRLLRYTCCVDVPLALARGSGEVGLQDLPGGRYAVLALPKDSAIIGAAIGRFHGEVLPRAGLRQDAARPIYEVYAPLTMEYCVPIL
jgi:AraC family transcriptional regulator